MTYTQTQTGTGPSGLKKHKNLNALPGTAESYESFSHGGGENFQADILSRPSYPDFKAVAFPNDISQRDALSGTLTRRAFLKVFQETFSYRSDSQGPLHADAPGMLCLIEIQKYHVIKNVYGSGVAMNCLREVGDILRSFCQEDTDGDIVAGRLEGSKFAILIRNSKSSKSMQYLHNLAIRFRGAHIVAGLNRINLEIDLGLKPYNSGDQAKETMAGADLFKHVMQEEDRQLKSRKQNRGNHEMRISVPN